MTEPYEADEITRELDAIFADYYGPPTEMDLRGVDPATFALGVCYGFDSWQDVRVVANNRRNVATAAAHWAEQHPSREFLAHAVGTDERALGHRQLLNRAHPGCAVCEEQLAQLERQPADDMDRVDPDALPDDLDLEWLVFQPIEVTRSESEAQDATGLLHIPDRDDNHPITAEHMGDRDWRITVRDPSARRATIRIRWSDGQETAHVVTFENDLADIDAEAPVDGAMPESVRIQVTESTDEP
jgi:hypothetical protein